MAGGNTSHSGADNFYGGITRKIPQQMYRSYLGPLTAGFGLGGYPGANKFQNQLENSNSPLADYIRQVSGFSGSVIPQAQALGADITSRAPQLFGQLQNQIGGALSALPGLQASGQGAVDRAQWLVDQAFSPITGRALYGETMQRALGDARQGQAARGLLEQGTSQQMEQDIGRDAAYQFALNDQSNQQGALSGLAGMLNNQVGLTQAGISPAAMGLSSLGDYMSLMQAGQQLPLAAAGNLFSLLSGGLAPGLQLASVTGPQQTSDAKGWKAL